MGLDRVVGPRIDELATVGPDDPVVLAGGEEMGRDRRQGDEREEQDEGVRDAQLHEALAGWPKARAAAA